MLISLFYSFNYYWSNVIIPQANACSDYVSLNSATYTATYTAIYTAICTATYSIIYCIIYCIINTVNSVLRVWSEEEKEDYN